MTVARRAKLSRQVVQGGVCRDQDLWNTPEREMDSNHGNIKTMGFVNDSYRVRPIHPDVGQSLNSSSRSIQDAALSVELGFAPGSVSRGVRYLEPVMTLRHNLSQARRSSQAPNEVSRAIRVVKDSQWP